MSEKAPIDYKTLLKESIIAMDKLKSRVSALESEKTEPIAVVGLACRFPGTAGDVDGFWDLLNNGQSAITEVPRDRWDIDEHYDPDPDAPGKIYTRYGGFLQNIDRFEPQFFGISPREAVSVDPQQRLLLEVAWEALENAGIAPPRLVGTSTGVFVGISFSEYGAQMHAAVPFTHRDLHSATGCALSISAGRLAYSLGVHGPTMALDTACSSSLVSVHLAMQSLRSKECQVALAGGVNVILSPDGWLVTCRGRMLAMDGRCKTFDASADGYVRGEGCGVIVLKRLKDAVRDGDRILSVLLGSAVNQDGRSSGLTAPNGVAQEALLRAALANAGVDGRRISYVEAHGTGTSLGDPIEMRAINAVFGAGRPAEAPLRVGSVKTNVGHLESAAGIAGLAKVILALQHRRIPGHLNFAVPSPRIPWSEIPVEIPTSGLEWSDSEGPRTAGVSAFGFSGTNAHVIVQEAPTEVAAASDDRPCRLFTFSARTDAALQQVAARHADHFAAQTPDFADACFTVNAGRARLDRRAAIVAASPADLAQKLSAVVTGADVADISRGQVHGTDRPKIAFLFTGQGSQYPGMGRQLFDQHPVFRQSMEECDALLGDISGRRLLSVIYPADSAGADTTLQQTGYAQPALFALEYSLARLFKSFGIEPAAVLGHSVGELAAACVAGVFSLADGLKLIEARGRLMQAQPAGGAMLAVSADLDAVRQALGSSLSTVAIAALNGPRDVVLSGDRRALAAIEQTLSASGIKSAWLNVSHAFHSPLMAPMIDEFAATAREVTYRRPSLRIVSNVTAAAASDHEPMNADYWCRHVLAPVRFSESLAAVQSAGYNLFVEVGPHPVLLALGRKADTGNSSTWLPTLRRGREDWQQVLTAVAELFVRGVEFDAEAIEQPRRGRRIALPTYPFERQRYWFDASARRSEPASGLHPLLQQRVQSPSLTDAVFTSRLSANAPTFIADHVVFDATVFPGTGYVEMALAGARLESGSDALVEDLQIEEPLIFDGEHDRDVQLTIAPAVDGRQAFRVFSRVASVAATGEPWTRHAAGFLRTAAATPVVEEQALTAARAACPAVVDVSALYNRLLGCGIGYGPSFRGIQQLWHGTNEALARLQLPAALEREKGYEIHPAFLDAALQVLGAAFEGTESQDQDELFLPVAVAAVRKHGPIPAAVWSHARVRHAEADARTVQADVRWFDDDGRVVLELEGVTVQRASASALRRRVAGSADDSVYEMSWEARALETAASTPGRWLILGEPGELASRLGDALREHDCSHLYGFAAADGLPGVDEYRLDLESESAVGDALSQIGTPLDGIVLLTPEGDVAGDTSIEAQERVFGAACRRTYALVKALARFEGQTPRVYLVTRGVQPAGSLPHPVDVAQAPLWGLGRVIALEHPQFRCTLIDLDPYAGSEHATLLADELVAQSREDQVAFRGGSRHVARLAAQRQAPSDRRLAIPDSPSFQLITTGRGVLDTLTLDRRERRAPEAGEVEIEVVASGLNFRDVLNALGMYPGDPGPMGGECAGRIVRVGAGVSEFQPGDEVVSIAGGSFSGFVVAPARAVVHKPASFSFEQMATVPVAFLTAHYGLHGIAGIKPGDRVLVHAGAGGVGMAALQLALRAGAEVYATAGSTEKREFVRSLGARAVFSSRQADFVEPLKALTGGRGVDIVLNALTGDFIPASLSVLAAGGRFLEIGKAEIWDPARVAAANPAVTYHPFDLTELMARDMEQLAAMFRDVLDGLGDGTLRPLPFRTFRIEDAITAYRFMAQARHVGKVVFSLAGRAEAPSPAVQSGGTYLITGGCGGLGLTFARWLAERRAGRIVLTGRSVPDAAAEQAIAEIREAGTTVDVVRADISSDADVTRVLAACEAADGQPLRGIIHAAGLLDDGVVVDQTWERTARVLEPKVRGAWLLHDRTRHRALDFFALFSSMSSVLGSPGQGSYAAANAYLDALAHHRRANGLAATSINWGAWSDVGMAARLESRDRARLTSRGLDLISPADGVRLFEQVLGAGATQTIVVPIRWPRLLEAYPHGTEPPVLEAFVARSRAAEASADTPSEEQAWQDVLSASSADQLALIQALVARDVRRVAGIGASGVLDIDAEWSMLGIDSLMAVELKNRVESATRMRLAIGELLEAATVRGLAQRLLASVNAPDRAPSDAGLVGAGAVEEGEL